jgi:hypothetical protein
MNISGQKARRHFQNYFSYFIVVVFYIPCHVVNITYLLQVLNRKQINKTWEKNGMQSPPGLAQFQLYGLILRSTYYEEK